MSEQSDKIFKTWVDVVLSDKNGELLSDDMILSESLTKGKHTVKIEHGEEGFIVTFDGVKSELISDTSTDVRNLLFSLTSTPNYKFSLQRADVDYSLLPSDSTLHFGASQFEVNAITGENTQAPTDPDEEKPNQKPDENPNQKPDDTNPEPEKMGCKSALGGGSIIGVAIIVLLTCFVLSMRKKRCDRKE